jgi:hypothetical protein
MNYELLIKYYFSIENDFTFTSGFCYLTFHKKIKQEKSYS